MTLDQIQPNLLTVLQAMSVFTLVRSHILIDDGIQSLASEESLKSEGLSILIMPPDCVGMVDRGQGVACMEYSSAIWLRTNPKVKSGGVTKWNPLALEKVIIPAVLAFGTAPTHYFRIPQDSDLWPETDFSDVGNNSRLIRFSTTCLLQ